MRRHTIETGKHWRIRCGALLLILIAAAALCAELIAPRFADISGEVIYQNDVVMLDASHTSQGYIAVRYTAQTDKDLLVKISKSSSTHTYTLNNNNEYEVFSFLDGSGSYTVKVYRQVKSSQFTQIYSRKLAVDLENDDDPYLYPNQYIWYTADTRAVALSLELCENAQSDQEKINILSDYVMRALAYDHIKAKTVKPGYIPSIDDILDKRKGICFDYSAVFACMLRVQNIPVKLVIGYADQYYHAWNTVWIDGQWVRYDLTFTDSGTKISKYTQEAVY